jgi:nicotinate-nucleotide--dimethylbenzimidazole phosphoribosyltransferase
MRLAKIQNKVPPEIRKKAVYVFAGDHGIAEEGVSLYPQEVTRQMMLNFLSGGAAINSLATGAGWDLAAVDAGIAGEFVPDKEPKPVCRFIRTETGRGSRNFYRTNALTEDEMNAALEEGKNLARAAAAEGYDLVAVGDMGIGNTSTAAAMMIAAGFSADDMIDRGTGIDNKMLEHKRFIITESVRLRVPEGNLNASHPGGLIPQKTGKDILTRLGSFDMAVMCGFILGFEGTGAACVLDGFPVTAAAYMAYMINPRVKDYLFAGHLSRVAGHAPLLKALELEPIVSLDMRLGEGTGAVIGGHIIELGVRAARGMASFGQAGVSGGGVQEEKY